MQPQAHLDDEEEEPVGLAQCQACGGTRFEWGSITAQVPIWLNRDEHKDAVRMFTPGKDTRVRICVRCGNMQIFVSLP